MADQFIVASSYRLFHNGPVLGRINEVHHAGLDMLLEDLGAMRNLIGPGGNLKLARIRNITDTLVADIVGVV